MLAEMSAAYGVMVRDPTADIRLLCYCLAVPPHLFIDPNTGLDRMLIRAAMSGRLPDAIRLNQRRGMQAADIVVRLRTDRDAMEACLDELAAQRCSLLCQSARYAARVASCTGAQ